MAGISLYGTTPPVSMQPGDRALLLGLEPVPGFMGSSNSGGNNPSPTAATPQTISSPGAGRPVVIAAMGGRHPATQRQLIWRVFGASGSVGEVALQVSIDDVAGNYVTIDTYSLSAGSNSAARVITADVSTTGTTPGPQSAAYILSAARFIRVQAVAGSVTAIIDCTCL